MKSALAIIPFLLPLPALAGGSATPTGSPASSALAHATSAARSTSSARVSGRVPSNVTVNNTLSSNSGSVRGDSSVSGGGSVSGNGGRDRAPDVVGASIGTSNPCGVGGSVGGSGPGAGGLLSWLTESDRCSLREDARLLWQMGEPDSAMQTACNNPWIADGRARAGHPCQRDVERWQHDGYRYTRRSDGVWVWER